MVARTECPHCRANFNVLADAIGRRVKCTRCGKGFVVAVRPEPEAEVFTAEDDANSDFEVVAAPGRQLPRRTTSTTAAATRVPAATSSGAAPSIRGESLRTIMDRAPDRWKGLATFGSQQTGLYTQGRVGSNCHVCGTPRELTTYAITWKTMRESIEPDIRTLIAFLIGGIWLSRTKRWVEFTTYHGLCGSCRNAHRLRRLTSAMAVMLMIPFFVIGLASTLISGFFMTAPHEEYAGDALLVSIALVVASVGLYFLARALRVPRQLRQIVPWPFEARKIKVIP